MKIFYTHTLGCKVNFADVQAVNQRLRRHGAGPVALVGTCCVTAEGERQSRKEVRRAMRRVGPAGRVFVTGCAARLSPEAFEGLGGNVTVVNGEPREVAAGIQAQLDTAPRDAAPGTAALAVDTDMAATSTLADANRTRFFLKIQDGCDNRCSYCVIPMVRGNPRSLPAATVLATAREMVAAGYHELVVSGINAGAWRDSGMDLAGLMASLVRIDGLARLRLSSIEATGVTEALLEVMAKHRSIGRHLHLPLQSGDDDVLAAMGRHYDTAAFAAAMARAREKVPGVNITTDVIIGFPGEDEAAFQKTMGFVETAGFTRVHVFSYSPPWYHQHVHGRLRIDVPDGDKILVLQNLLRRRLTGDDPAEKTIIPAQSSITSPSTSPSTPCSVTSIPRTHTSPL